MAATSVAQIRATRTDVIPLFPIRARLLLVESSSRSTSLFEHDLFRKPVATFRDHALAERRQADAETGSEPPRLAVGAGRPEPVLGLDVAPVRLDDLARDRQAQP